MAKDGLEIKSGLSILVVEKMEELEELQEEYDKNHRSMAIHTKIDWLEELVVKTQLVMSTLIKTHRYLMNDLNNLDSYMYRSDLEKTIATIKEYSNIYKSSLYSLTEVLKMERIRLESTNDLNKIDVRMN